MKHSLRSAHAVLMVVAALAACDDAATTASSTSSSASSSSASTGGAGGGHPARLELDFVGIPFATELPYITDLAFVPGASGEFLASDLYGGIELGKITGDATEISFSAKIPDVYAEYDAGLLSVAIDPDFASNGYFYAGLNLATNHVVVRRYTLDRADPAATIASAVPILDLQVLSSPRWHNITSMGFEPDGTMWLLVGDKGIALPNAPDPTKTVAQDEKSLLGSLLRIRPSKEKGVGGYQPVAGAPLYSPTADPAIFAKGLRSPWQGLYHEGRWYYGEVGLDTFEELNVISAAGQNFGWPVVEGPCALDIHMNMPDCTKYVEPWVYVDRSSSSPFVLDDSEAVPTGKRSIYAGWIYRPTENDPYQGLWNDVLVWGDAFVGFMRASKLDGDPNGWHLGHHPFPSAWDQGPDGFVYMVSLSAEPDPKDPVGMGPPSPLRRAVLKTH
ncbi:MAG: PQQ-dependent sugar dehydrogenase [Polyangiaceae bacterium]